jgi:glutamine cyclotransferase
VETGRVVERTELDGALFGEGLTLWGDRLIQLTWTSGLGLVYRREGLAPIDTLTYSGEGWGLTHDGERLIMTDGGAALIFRDPETFERLGAVLVTDFDGTPVRHLNELAYVEGRVLANVWKTDRVAVIDPGSGDVEAWIDLAGLLDVREAAEADVLNGIAYDPERGELLVTGKLWPTLFRIRLEPTGD